MNAPDPWLRLALVPGVGNTSLIRLLTAFGSPEAVLSSGRSVLAAHLTPAQCDALLAEPDAAQLESAQAWLAQPGNSLMTLADTDYPKALLEIADPPAVLYCKGQRALLSQPALGIVGSRNATPQGVRDAEAFAHALSDAGLTIVSGLALGIDAAPTAADWPAQARASPSSAPGSTASIPRATRRWRTSWPKTD